MASLRALALPCLLFSVSVSVSLFACKGDSDEGGGLEFPCTPGALDCECIAANSGCDPGLICIADICEVSSETGNDDSSADTGETAGDGDGDTTTGDGDGDTGDEGCHPLMIDCPIGTTCTYDAGAFFCNTATTKLGDSCVPGNPVCVSGFCAPQAEVPGCPSTHCCAGFCNLDTGYCSVEGTACVDYFPPGATTPEVGACIQ